MAYVLLRRRFMALLTRECPGGTRAYKVRKSESLGEKHQGVGLGALRMALLRFHEPVYVCICMYV